MNTKKLFPTGKLLENGLAELKSENYIVAESIFEKMSDKNQIYGDKDCDSPAFLLGKAYVSLATAAKIAVSGPETEQAYKEMTKAHDYASELGKKVASATKEHTVYRASDGFWVTQERVEEFCKIWKDIREKYFHEDERLSSLL